jgi:hypothetical protein
MLLDMLLAAIGRDDSYCDHPRQFLLRVVGRSVAATG